MKRLVLTLAILASFTFGGMAQNVWRPIGMDGEFLGVSANGNVFTNMGYSGMFRSQDEGETWEHIDVASYVRKETFMINEQDRIFIFDENTYKLIYSDDNGDSWQEQTSGISTNWPLGMFSLSNDTIFICSREKFHWTLDGGESWDETPIDFIGEANFGSILADHAGNVYASTYSWTYPVEQVGIYTATLDDMTHWTVKTLGGAREMAFDSEGYILATGPGPASFENGVYHINADRFALINDDVIFAMKRVDWDNEALFYSTDHGQTYIQCSENIPSTTTAPDPDLGLYKGRDNHLYCHGDVWEPTFESQYYKSIQNADEIISDTPTNVVVYSLWKPINLPGTLLGANDQGYMFSTNYDSPQSLMRSHDDGETWETVLTGSIGNLTISNEGRIFVFSHNTMTVMYSDDNGDTWQQTSQISPCGMIDIPRLFATTNDIIVGWAQNGEIFWTLDGGDTWNGTILDFMEDHQEISDLLVSENGDVYVSVWYYIGPNIGVYHSTLSDMQNWEIAAFEDVGIKDMAFDPEGNIVCAVNFGGDFSGFEHVPGFYAFWANRVAIADNGIVYKTAMTLYDNAVLAYSLDHGEHFYNTIEDLPVSEPIPGGEDGFLSKGYDNHLYFLGNDQYWKSIPNANDIPNVISFPSEWYYEILNENGSITYQYMYQAGDTIVQDEPTHILVRINTLYDKDVHEEMTHEYVYMRDGKVYWWNKTLEEFTVLYDFGAQEGDSWVTKVGTETLIMHVNAVETVEYEDKTYRMLHVSDVDGLFSGDIVCGIGHLTSFFPERLMGDGDRMRVEGLRCYWIDDNLVFKLGDEDCDAIISEIHNVEENDPSTPSTGSGTEGTLVVYPNPTNGILFVQTLRATSLHDNTYRITNLMGQTVLTGSLNAETQQIDVTGLAEGMYFVTVGDATRKFVVNK